MATQAGVKLVDPVCTLAFSTSVEVGPWQVVGNMGKGVRRILPMLGGTFHIPAQEAGTFHTREVRGTVVGGADWQVIHSDSLSELDARITLKTEDGHFILLRASGRRFAPPDVLKRLLAGEPVQRTEYYGVSSTVVETSAPGLEWMNYHQFVGNARTEGSIHHVRYFAIDYPVHQEEKT
jgi:hypothetical protein